MNLISPHQRLARLPFQPAHISANSAWPHLRLEDYRFLPPSDLRLQPMSYHIIAFHYKPPKGVLRHRCGGRWQEGQLRQFDITYVPAFRDNQWQFDGQNPHCFHILLDDAFIRQTIEQAWDVAAELIWLTPQFQCHTAVLQQVSFHLHHALLNQRGQDVLYLESLGLTLASALLSTFANQQTQPQLAHQLSDRQFQRVVDFLQAHLPEPVTLQQMAALLNMSVYHFSRLFRNRTRRSPYQFLLGLRLRQAKTLLLASPKRPLSEVALLAGFSDQSHFTRHFRKAFGLTPHVFRQQYSKNVID